MLLLVVAAGDAGPWRLLLVRSVYDYGQHDAQAYASAASTSIWLLPIVQLFFRGSLAVMSKPVVEVLVVLSDDGTVAVGSPCREQQALYGILLKALFAVHDGAPGLSPSKILRARPGESPN